MLPEVMKKTFGLPKEVQMTSTLEDVILSLECQAFVSDLGSWLVRGDPENVYELMEVLNDDGVIALVGRGAVKKVQRFSVEFRLITSGVVSKHMARTEEQAERIKARLLKVDPSRAVEIVPIEIEVEDRDAWRVEPA